MIRSTRRATARRYRRRFWAGRGRLVGRRCRFVAGEAASPNVAGSGTYAVDASPSTRVFDESRPEDTLEATRPGRRRCLRSRQPGIDPRASAHIVGGHRRGSRTAGRPQTEAPQAWGRPDVASRAEARGLFVLERTDRGGGYPHAADPAAFAREHVVESIHPILVTRARGAHLAWAGARHRETCSRRHPAAVSGQRIRVERAGIRCLAHPYSREPGLLWARPFAAGERNRLGDQAADPRPPSAQWVTKRSSRDPCGFPDDEGKGPVEADPLPHGRARGWHGRADSKAPHGRSDRGGHALVEGEVADLGGP